MPSPRLASYHNVTSTFSNSTVIPSPDTEFITVVIFFVGTIIIHIMTTHVVTPKSTYATVKQYLGIIISPITAGISSFNPLFLLASEFTREEPVSSQHLTSAQRALWASALAIQFPAEFIPLLKEQDLVWKGVPNGVPITNHNQSSVDRSSIFILPCTYRIIDGRYDRYTQPPISNTLGTILALLQLLYTAVQAYMQYGPAIRDYGISSPYIVVFPYLYMSFINLLANLGGNVLPCHGFNPRSQFVFPLQYIYVADTCCATTFVIGYIRSSSRLARDRISGARSDRTA